MMGEPSVVTTIIVAALGQAGALGGALLLVWGNLKGKSLDLSKELSANSDRLKHVEEKVDAIRSDLALHDGSIKVLNVQIQHLTTRHDDLSKRFDANILKRVTTLERQGGAESQ